MIDGLIMPVNMGELTLSLTIRRIFLFIFISRHRLSRQFI